MKDVNGASVMKIDNTGTIQMKSIKIYNKALMVTDIIGNYRAGER
jgi:hypothetical protein